MSTCTTNTSQIHQDSAYLELHAALFSSLRRCWLPLGLQAELLGMLQEQAYDSAYEDLGATMFGAGLTCTAAVALGSVLGINVIQNFRWEQGALAPPPSLPLLPYVALFLSSLCAFVRACVRACMMCVLHMCVRGCLCVCACPHVRLLPTPAPCVRAQASKCQHLIKCFQVPEIACLNLLAAQHWLGQRELRPSL